MADTKAANSGKLKKRKKKEIANSAFVGYLPGTSHLSHRHTQATVLKKLTKNLATRNSPFTVYRYRTQETLY